MTAKKSSKKIDYNEFDLRKLDLTRKYDEDFSPTDGISIREHILLYMICAFLLVFIVWASIAKLDEVSRGIARVIPSSEIQIIQSLEGGIIESIAVKEGDEVKEGQILLNMHNVQAGAEFGATTQKYLALLATVARLQAEAEGRSTIDFPDEVRQGAPDILISQEDAFRANKRNNESQIAVLQEQLNQKNQEMRELKGKIADTSNVISLSRNERAMVAPMVEKGSSSKRDLLQIDRQIAQQTTELNSLRLALPRAQNAAEEIQQRIAQMTSGFQANAQKELSERTAELNAIRQTLASYKDRSERSAIKSPMHGTVKDIKIRTVGGVARPGEAIMEIVPLEDQLLIEAQIKPSDIAFLHPGLKAIVRITAFDSSIYGTLEGVVADISADSIATDKGESYYRVRVKTEKTSLKKDGKDYPIIPGMQATVDIVTGEKTIMTYLTKPFMKAAQTAMRER